MLVPPLGFHHGRCERRWDREWLQQPPRPCLSAALVFSPAVAPGPTSASASLQGPVDWVLLPGQLGAPDESYSKISSSGESGQFGCRAESFQSELPAGRNGRVFSIGISCCLLPGLPTTDFVDFWIIC